jgi:hypothetical protein
MIQRSPGSNVFHAQNFSISFPLLLLFVFIYTNFFISQAIIIAPILELPSIPQTNIILPIDISFYTLIEFLENWRNNFDGIGCEEIFQSPVLLKNALNGKK